MKIIGIDPGISTAGIGLIRTDGTNGLESLDWLTITTEPTLPLADRLLELATDLDAYLKETKPDLAVVETLFFATNKRTAMAVSQARGVIVVTLKQNGIDVIDATPLQLKTAITGDGKADKKQMQSMVKRTLNLKETPTPADAADGLALALFGAFMQKHHVKLTTTPSRTSHVRRPIS